MNIQNIIALHEILVTTGFHGSIGYRLLQHICFKQSRFTIREQVYKGKDVLTCSICFERKGDEYICNYYDASFLKHMDVPDLVIQGIGLHELDQRMQQIDWDIDDSLVEGFRMSDQSAWHREKQIEKIVADIDRLLVSVEGKHFAELLKLKYWSALDESLTGNLAPLRSRFEISQRFYFYDGQGISVDEAYRFLLNRWLEKRLQAKRREERDPPGTDSSEGDTEAATKSLLQKKRQKKGVKVKQ